MERRSFIRGLLIGIPATGQALIQLASPAEASALVPQRDILLGQPPPMTAFPGGFPMGCEVYMFYQGEYRPIGLLTRVEMHNSMEDVSSAWSGTIEMIPGLQRRIRGDFEGHR